MSKQALNIVHLTAVVLLVFGYILSSMWFPIIAITMDVGALIWFLRTKG
jgi:hypothetical protein